MLLCHIPRLFAVATYVSVTHCVKTPCVDLIWLNSLDCNCCVSRVCKTAPSTPHNDVALTMPLPNHAIASAGSTMTRLFLALVGPLVASAANVHLRSSPTVCWDYEVHMSSKYQSCCLLECSRCNIHSFRASRAFANNLRLCSSFDRINV